MKEISVLGESVYLVDGKNKRAATLKAMSLVRSAGMTPLSATAQKFLGGEDYGLNWQVIVSWQGPPTDVTNDLSGLSSDQRP